MALGFPIMPNQGQLAATAMQGAQPNQQAVEPGPAQPFNIQMPQFNLGNQSAQTTGGPMQNLINQSQGLYGGLMNQQGFLGSPQGGGALNFLLQDAPFAGSNPYLQSHMRAASQPLIQDFQEQILPSIGDSASAAGQFGSSRQGIAEGLAASRLGQQIGRQNTQLASQGYQQGLGAMQNALRTGVRGDLGQQRQLSNLLQQAPEMAALGLMPSTALGRIGAQRQGQVQNLLNDMQQRFNFYQQQPGQSLQDYASIIQGLQPGGGQTTTTTPVSAGGPMGALGGALGGAQMGSDLGSLIGDIFGGNQIQQIDTSQLPQRISGF